MFKYLSIFIIFIFLSCQYDKIIILDEPIKIYIEYDIPKIGIKIWNRNIIYVDYDNNPDLIIIKTNYLPNNWWAMEHHEYNIFGCLKKPVYIYILENRINNVIIAHEIGHILGYEDSCKDLNSIMCAGYNQIYKPLTNFTEFKN